MATSGWENSRIMDNISTNNINISLNYSYEQVQNALNSVYGHPNFVRQLQSTESINIYQFTCHNSIQNIEIIIKKESSSIDLTIRSMYENASKYKRIAIVNLSQSVLNCILDCLENSIYKSKEDFIQERLESKYDKYIKDRFDRYFNPPAPDSTKSDSVIGWIFTILFIIFGIVMLYGVIQLVFF